MICIYISVCCRFETLHHVVFNTTPRSVSRSFFDVFEAFLCFFNFNTLEILIN